MTDHTRYDITIAEWVRSNLGAYTMITHSEPQPVLIDYNLLAVGRSADAVRDVVLAWERLEEHDGNVGFVAMADSDLDPSANAERGEHFDPSHELEHASKRARLGILPGLVVGAVVITLLAWVIVGWSPVLIGAAIGGAAFGGVAGGMINFATKTGWGAAYQDSFVDEDGTSLAIASIHSGDLATIERAAQAAIESDGVELHALDRSGRRLW